MKLNHANNYLKYNELKTLNALDYIYTMYSKGDYINFALENDGRIKTIDSAIPSSVAKNLMALNISYSNFVTIYFKNGNVEYCNMLEYCTILIKGL